MPSAGLSIPRWVLLVPFACIAYIHWVRSIAVQRQIRPVTTIEQRDFHRARTATMRITRRRARAASAAAMQQPRTTQQQQQTAQQQPAAAGAIALGRRSCPASRKPYHTLLTATAQVYQQWQCRVMYYHWKKQRDLDPAGECTELTGFTRLVAHQDGNPDGLEREIPSFFVKEYSQRDYVRFRGYRVINRPYSVVQFLKSEYYRSQVREDYIYIAETDHILTQPLPNKASLGSPMAYIFNYMGPNPAHSSIIARAWPEGGSTGYQRVQSIGPSPVVIHRKDLERMATPWEETAVALKTDDAADQRLGWVIEMWGYAIAAAKIGLKHQEFPDFQVEPGALSTSNQLRGFPKRYWVFHYTYQFEYMLDGSPCAPWTIGEFSLDKRHFSDVYPVPPLPEPPAKANPAAFYLLRAFNEAMANISNWPRRQPAGVTAVEPAGSGGQRPVQTLYGRRRLDWFSRHQNGFATELRTMPLIKKLAGSTWSCIPSNGGSEASLELGGSGDASGLSSGHGWGRSSGRWGSMNDPTFGKACPVYECIFIDSGGAQREARVHPSGTELTVMSHPRGDQEPAVLFKCTAK